MEKKHWYVLRDLRRQNTKERAYQVLQDPQYDIERVFTPTVQKIVMNHGRKEVRTVPFVSDLLFAYDSREHLDAVVESIPMLIYYFARGGGYNNPVFVPDDQMADFLHAVGQQPDRVQYFTPEQVSPTIYGRSIRIIGGALDGYEGRLMSRRGSRKKQLIIELEGLLSAAIEVEPDYIQLL